jgi:hypothetical protein
MKTVVAGGQCRDSIATFVTNWKFMCTVYFSFSSSFFTLCFSSPLKQRFIVSEYGVFSFEQVNSYEMKSGGTHKEPHFCRISTCESFVCLEKCSCNFYHILILQS